MGLILQLYKESFQDNVCSYFQDVFYVSILALLYAERLSNSLDLISDHVMYLVNNS